MGNKASAAGITADLSAFAAAGLAACVGNDPHTLALLRASFPATRFVALPTGVTADMLDAILEGACAGGIAGSLDLRFALGPQDTSRAYCGMQLTGGRLSQISYGIPFNRATVNGSTMAAMNILAAAAYAHGDYATQASAPTFPSPATRAACGASGAGGLGDVTGLSALTITQVSGIFFILVFGAVVAAVTFAVFHYMAVRAGDAAGGTDDGKDGGGEEDAQAETRAKLVTKEEAVASLCGVLAREAVAALDVPPRVRAAADAARGERGAALRITLQLRDVSGRAYGRRFEAELPHASDWRYLYTRLHPDDAARFARTLRALAAGKPRPAGGHEGEEDEDDEDDEERGGGGGGDGMRQRRRMVAPSPAPSSMYDEEAGVPTLQRASGWAYNTPSQQQQQHKAMNGAAGGASRRQLAALWEPASEAPSAAPSGAGYAQPQARARTQRAPPFSFPSLRSTFAGLFMPPQRADSAASLPPAAVSARQSRAVRTGRGDAWAMGKESSNGGVSFARGTTAEEDAEEDAARRRALRGSLSVGALSRSRSSAPGDGDALAASASMRRAASSVGAGARSRGSADEDGGGGARSFRRAASAVASESASRAGRSMTRDVEADSGAAPPPRNSRRGKSTGRIPSFDD